MRPDVHAQDAILLNESLILTAQRLLLNASLCQLSGLSAIASHHQPYSTLLEPS